MERSPLPAIELSRALFDRLCLTRQVIPSAAAPIRFAPGYDLMERSEAVVAINGRYGLVLSVDEEGRLPVAQAGFDFTAAEMTVTNSPQGLIREKLSHLSRSEQQEIFRVLKQGTFRDDLMEALLKIGKTLQPVGVTTLRALPAEYHDKVDLNGGPLPFTRAVAIMDAVYERHGFIREEHGDFVLTMT